MEAWTEGNTAQRRLLKETMLFLEDAFEPPISDASWERIVEILGLVPMHDATYGDPSLGLKITDPSTGEEHIATIEEDYEAERHVIVFANSRRASETVTLRARDSIVVFEDGGGGAPPAAEGAKNTAPGLTGSVCYQAHNGCCCHLRRSTLLVWGCNLVRLRAGGRVDGGAPRCVAEGPRYNGQDVPPA